MTTDNTPTAVALENATIGYRPDRPILHELQLSVRKGELLGILGSSGSGKTTLLKAIAGILPVTSGRVLLAGREVTSLSPRARRVGLVFQNLALFPQMSVRNNVGFGLQYLGLPEAVRRERVTRLLRLLHLEEFAARRPRELSGGQAQRVALGRVLAMEPNTLLLDEPFSHLDRPLADAAASLVLQLHREQALTTILVTHDRDQALSVSDRIAVLGSEGLIIQIGTPSEVYQTPISEEAAILTGVANKLPARLHGDNGSERIDLGVGTLRPSSIPETLPRAATLLFRPEWATAHRDDGSPLKDNELRARATHVISAGGQQHFRCQIGDSSLVIPYQNHETLSVNTTVRINLDPERVLLFPETKTTEPRYEN